MKFRIFDILIISSIVIFSMYHILRSPDYIMVDETGNIDSYAKSFYCLFDKKGFYEQQKKIVLFELKQSETIDTKVTRDDIELEKIMLSIDDMDKDYKETHAEDMADKQIANLIIQDRTVSNNDYKDRLNRILTHINTVLTEKQ